MGGAYNTYGGEMHTGFCWGNLRERVQLEDQGLDLRLILKWIFRKGMVGCTELIWLRTGTGGNGHL